MFTLDDPVVAGAVNDLCEAIIERSPTHRWLMRQRQPFRTVATVGVYALGGTVVAGWIVEGVARHLVARLRGRCS